MAMLSCTTVYHAILCKDIDMILNLLHLHLTFVYFYIQNRFTYDSLAFEGVDVFVFGYMKLTINIVQLKLALGWY